MVKSQLDIIINNSELHSYKPTQCKRDTHPQSKRQFEQKTSAFLQYQGIGYNNIPQEIKEKLNWKHLEDILKNILVKKIYYIIENFLEE